MMKKNYHRIGLVNGAALLLTTLCAVALSRYTHSASALSAAFIFASGFAVALVSYFQMRLEEREHLEKLEFDELVKSKSSESLFTTQADTFPARRSRELFERFFIPALTLLHVLGQSFAIYWHWKKAGTVIPLIEGRAPIALGIFGLLALILFLCGKYASSLARLDGERLLRAGSGFMLVSAYTCALVAIAIGAVVWGGIPKADFYAARLLVVLLALVALELSVSLILDLYRPRVPGRVERLVYESRVVGLMGQPEGVFSTAAHALDYQFGFKVSETWFYQFLQRSFVWILLGQIALLAFSTCVIFINTGEQGLKERFGRPSGEVLNPGPHFKWPWPVESVRRISTREVQSLNIGFVPDSNLEREKTVLWTRPHFKEEFNLLVASSEQNTTNAAGRQQNVPANLLTVSIPVQYQIDDVRAWAYNHSDAGQLLEKVATREVVVYLVGVDLIEIMSSGRLKAGQELHERIQAQANALGLGVKILFVGLQDIHPPVKVAEDFQKVVGATQEKEATILRAEGYAARVLPTARAEAEEKIRAAEGERFTKVAAANARATQFTNQIAAFTASPTVYPQRLYLDTFSRVVAGARKYVIAATNAEEVIQFNLEDKIRADLLDVTVPPPTTR